MNAAYVLRAVATSPLPKRAPDYITLAVCAVDPIDFARTREELYPWTLNMLRESREFGLYAAEFGLLGDDGEEAPEVCFREELLLWDGSKLLLRETRDLV